MDLKFVKAVKGDQLPPEAQGMAKDEPKLDANAIPDIEKLLATVIEFLRYINTDEMHKLESTDQLAFERHLDSKFENLSLRYYTIFKLLLDKEHREDNVCKLIEIFSVLKGVKSGSIDIQKANEDFQEELNNEYIYPKFGGKEQFEKKMRKGIKKKNKK